MLEEFLNGFSLRVALHRSLRSDRCEAAIYGNLRANVVPRVWCWSIMRNVIHTARRVAISCFNLQSGGVVAIQDAVVERRSSRALRERSMTQIVKAIPGHAGRVSKHRDRKARDEEIEVEPKGIEPSTSCMPCRRSPK